MLSLQSPLCFQTLSLNLVGGVLSFCFALSSLLFAGDPASELPVLVDPNKSHDLSIKEENGIWDILTQGTDPYFLTNKLESDQVFEDRSVLAFEYFCPDGLGYLRVYYGPPFNEAHTVTSGSLPKTEVWQPFAVDLKTLSEGRWKPDLNQFHLKMGGKAGVRLQIRNLRLRSASAEEVASKAALEMAREQKKVLSENMRRYYETQFPAKVTAVSATGDVLKVDGCLPVESSGDCYLAEILPSETPWENPKCETVFPVSGSEFHLSVPRYAEGRDRLFSRFCVVRLKAHARPELLSHAAYVSDLSALGNSAFPVVRARSKKGMGGVMGCEISNELGEMGMEHVTVNIPLQSFMRLQKSADTFEFSFEGHIYHISKGGISGVDRNVSVFSNQGMAVSAIILIPFGKEEEKRVWNHPEACAPGTYSMPNLTTEEGARAYRAALSFLAKRYSSVEHGVIHQWILHNEIDYGWTWTNMGEQPMNLYMDHYIRSMRTAYLAARQVNPFAKVFISLTHNWTTPEGSSGKNYVTRDMLDVLESASRLEGDFEWGIAYHPYPQSLFHPAAWNDSKAIFSFDTPLITPKNIEVLDAYLHQPRFLYQGKILRSVMLSEQGFHTKDYSETEQRLQAAAFVYTWHKIRPLETIICFQNHRWIDHGGEGGLKLGVRTLAEPGKPFGDKKLSWLVYQALDTPKEESETAFAKEVIGVKDFAEIPYRGVIEKGRVAK
ncbi:MAG: DUF5722 domain-containing protein [Verrucomicrobiota bacterium]